jgi:hypothetical protein
MKLALLGCDREALELAQATQLMPSWRIVAGVDVGEYRADLEKLAPTARFGDDWESLLHGTVADAVVVAGGGYDPRRQDQLRKLTQAAIPQLLVHPVCEPIIGFELEMIQQDSGCILIPFFPGCNHPLLDELGRIVAGSESTPIGLVEQIVFERSCATHERDRVTQQLTRDIHVCHRLCGPLSQVSAVVPSHDANDYSNLVVTLTARSGLLVRWSLIPAGGASGGTITLMGSRKRASLAILPDENQWALTIDGQRIDHPVIGRPTGHERILARLQSMIDNQNPGQLWRAACQDFEVVDAVQESLRRRRTIDLHGAEHSEESSFKGVMAMGGCGLILMFLLILFAGSIVEGLRMPARDPANRLQHETDGQHDTPHPRVHFLLRIWPVYPFAVFLLLQLLFLVFRPKPHSSPHTNSPTNRSLGDPSHPPDANGSER